jgi:hypothetical protein
MQTRADALWLSENHSDLGSSDVTITHPNAIRQAHREALKALPAPLVDSSLFIESPTAAPQATREAVWAVKGKVLKVNAHATATPGP